MKKNEEIVKEIDDIGKSNETSEIENKSGEKIDNSSTKKEDSDKDDDNTYKYFIYGLVIALAIIVIISLINSIQTTNTQTTYNNFKFEKDSDGNWVTRVQKDGQVYRLAFDYYPTEVENITIDALIKSRIWGLNSTATLFIAPEENTSSLAVLGGAQIARLYKHRLISVPVQSALFDPNLNVEAYMNDNSSGPLRINQRMALDNQVIMRFKDSEITAMYFADDSYNLIYVDAAEPEDFRKLCDKLGYQLLGIIVD